jgi:hypothetical protein
MGCAEPAPAPAVSTPPKAAKGPIAVQEPKPATPTPEEAQPPAPPPETTAPAEAARPTFPPSDITPPFERTSQEGDGHWAAFGNEALGELASASPALFHRSIIHPHPASRYHVLTVVAIDLERASLHYVPGSEDENLSRLPKDLKPGLIPASESDQVLAVFNGGFQPRHGWWGMMAAEKVLVPPRDIGCTLAIYKDGTVRLAPWSSLSSTQSEMLAFRQTPPCLLDNGEVHRLLTARQDKMWAGKNPNEITRRRSAVGLSADGKVLYYGVGIELDALQLAQAMKLIGATQAAELDINWNWTRFLMFGKSEPSASLKVTSTLLEGMVYNSRSYVARAEARDFFYLLRRK